MRKIIYFLIRFIIILVACYGLAICIWWYPYQLNLVNFDGYMTQKIINLQLAFYRGVSLPCFIVLGFGWRLSRYLLKGDEFSSRVKKLLIACTWILLADVTLFLIGNIVFLYFKWNVYSYIYLLLVIFGYMVAFAFAVLAYYVGKARVLKEENELYV